MKNRFLNLSLCFGLLALTITSAQATTILNLGWEDGIYPTGSYQVGFYGANSIANLQSSGLFAATNPLASPAGGIRALKLSTPISSNSGLALPTGTVIKAHATYTLTAAIGHALDGLDNAHWSLQFWAGGSATDSSLSGFLGQQYGGTVSAHNPAAGLWELNSYSFTTDNPIYAGAVGHQLIAFLNTYMPIAVSYYDNVVVTEQVAGVAEPASFLLLGGALLTMMVFLRNRATITT